MSSNTNFTALSQKDANAPIMESAVNNSGAKGEVKSMEYHRQVLQSKMEAEKPSTYISPSDEIMSPCTSKLSAYRNRQVGKVKPKSLFAKKIESQHSSALAKE